MASKLCDDFLAFRKRCNMSHRNAEEIAHTLLATQVRIAPWAEAFAHATDQNISEFMARCNIQDTSTEISHASGWQPESWRYFFRGATLNRNGMSIKSHIFEDFCKLKDIASRPESEQLMLFHILNSENMLRNRFRAFGVKDLEAIESFVDQVKRNSKDGSVSTEIGQIICNTTFPAIRDEVQPLVDNEMEQERVRRHNQRQKPHERQRVRRKAPRPIARPAEDGRVKWTNDDDRALQVNRMFKLYKQGARLTGRPTSIETMRQMFIAALCKDDRTLQSIMVPAQDRFYTQISKFVNGNFKQQLQAMTPQEWTHLLQLVEAQDLTAARATTQVQEFEKMLRPAINARVYAKLTNKDILGRFLTAHLQDKWDTHWTEVPWAINSRIRGAVNLYREQHEAVKPEVIMAIFPMQ